MASTSHTSVYMRGLYDGFHIGAQQEMTPKKFKMTLDSQTAICKKIFEFVPKTEAWTAQQIVTSMSRTGSTRPELKTAEGCLNSLTSAGLVKEAQRGLFQAVVPREPITLPDAPETAFLRVDSSAPAIARLPVLTDAVTMNVEVVHPANPETTLGDIAVKLRLKAQSLMKMADEIDSAALQFGEQLDGATQKLNRFNALKALLTEA